MQPKSGNVFRLLDWLAAQHPHLTASQVIRLVAQGQDTSAWSEREWRAALAAAMAPGMRP